MRAAAKDVLVAWGQPAVGVGQVLRGRVRREALAWHLMSEPEQTPPEALPGDQLYRIAWVFYLFLAIGGALWVGARDGTIPLALFVDPGGWWIDLGLGVAAAGLLLGLWQAGLRLLPSAGDLEAKLGEMLRGVETPEVIALALLSGFAEELFFRGFLQPRVGIPLSTALFALAHLSYDQPAMLVGITLLSLAFAFIVRWRQNVWAAVVAHAVFDAIQLIFVIPWALRLMESDGPEFLAVVVW